DQIKKLESVNEFTLRDIDDPNVYKFNYKDLTLLAIQTSKNDNVLSRINFSLMCENLLNKVTKEKILEKINEFNRRTLTLKITLQKIEEKDVFLKFSIEYGIDDKLFEYINIEKNLKLLFSAPNVLVKEILKEEENPNE
ncbi:TPA: hypothetical protein VAM21_003626, partial [Acinetobacter baumannii]|nr:hypothetical protein [Acinetobacter baumannii]